MERSGVFRIAVRKYPPFEQAIRAQWDAFEAEAKSGLALELVAFELHALEESLFGSNGMRDGDWDVCFVATDWIASMYAQGCAVDLAPLLKADPPQDYPQGWTESLLRLQRVRDAVLGVPYHDGPECLIYRRDLFEDDVLREAFEVEFGEALTIPKSWEAFHRVARFMQRAGRGVYGTVFAAFPDGHNSVYDFLLQLWTCGGELFDADGAVRFETRAAAEALTFYREMLTHDGAVHPECRALDSVGAGMAFAAGQVAMMINWFGFATMAHISAESAVRGLVDVAELPHAAGVKTASLNVYWILSMAVGSVHRDVSWQFLRHGLNPAMDKLTTMSGAIGCRRSTWSDTEVNAAIPFYHRIEHLHAHAREIPQRADWPRIAAVIDEMVTANISGDVPVIQLLRQADAKVR